MSLWYERFRLSDKPDLRILTEEVRKRAWIGRKHWKARLQRIPDNMIYKATIKDYIDNMPDNEAQGKGLLLYGTLGGGKTSVATILLRNALARGARVLSIRFTDMVDYLLEKYQRSLPNGAPLEEGLRNVNYLLIDDMEIDDATWRERKFEAILRHRDAEGLPTIISTNMTKKQIFDNDWLKSLLSNKERYMGVRIDGINWRSDPPSAPGDK